MRSSDIRANRLPRRRGGLLGVLSGGGYVAEEVDAFLERCADALEAYERRRPPTGLHSRDVVHQRFGHTRLGEPYDPDAVDDFLDEVATALRAHEARPTGPAAD